MSQQDLGQIIFNIPLDLGNSFISLEQVKDYLSISSNTFDARLSNIITYATSAVESYIGYQVLANTYTETFTGGKSAVFVSRIPLSNVHSVQEYNGTDYVYLNDPTSTGTIVDTTKGTTDFTLYNSASLNERIKKFGKSSLKLGNNDYAKSTSVSEDLAFEDTDFTIEAFVRVDEEIIRDNVIFSINTDSANYLSFALSNQYGLSFTANIAGTATTVTGANTNIESQQFANKQWAHVAVTRDYSNELLYLHYNGNTINNTSFTVSNLTFTANAIIGETFKGYIDEIIVSTKAKYKTNFTPATNRAVTDSDTVLLLHFDEGKSSTTVKDKCGVAPDYIFERETGKVSKQTSVPTDLSLTSLPTFAPYHNSVIINYTAGYSSVPHDLQLATLDYVKTLYKQTQENMNFSLQGESNTKYPLSTNIPPHIKRILELYRII